MALPVARARQLAVLWHACHGQDCRGARVARADGRSTVVCALDRLAHRLLPSPTMALQGPDDSLGVRKSQPAWPVPNGIARPSLARLDCFTQRARLAVLRADGLLECQACARRCALLDGERGACAVRRRAGDELLAPYGFEVRSSIEPIEALGLFHVAPGTIAMQFGMFGPDLGRRRCRTAPLTRAVRDDFGPDLPRARSARGLVGLAVAMGAQAICVSDHEPLFALEWIRDVFATAREQDLLTVLLTRGCPTPEAITFLRPVTHAMRFDVQAAFGQHAGGAADVEAQWRAIAHARALGAWVEIRTVLTPALSDDPDHLRAIADRILAIDTRTPWHLVGHYPRHRLDRRSTISTGELLFAVRCGYGRGLHYVYGTNASGVGALRDTVCVRCKAVAIERDGIGVVKNGVSGGRCSACWSKVPGRWPIDPPRQPTRPSISA